VGSGAAVSSGVRVFRVGGVTFSACDSRSSGVADGRSINGGRPADGTDDGRTGRLPLSASQAVSPRNVPSRIPAARSTAPGRRLSEDILMPGPHHPAVGKLAPTLDPAQRNVLIREG
jgi:hypothetical protein